MTLLLLVLAGPVLAFLDFFSPPDPISRVGGFSKSYFYTLSVFFENVVVENAYLPQRASPRVFLTVWWWWW